MKDLSKYILASFTDESWIKQYEAEMGKEEFWKYKDNVYRLIHNLKVDQSLEIEKWCKSENLDLFIKIACCYVQESKSCYCFKNNYAIIKHQFDAREMEKTLTLFKRQRREKESGAIGLGDGSGQRGVEAISAQEPEIQD